MCCLFSLKFPILSSVNKLVFCFRYRARVTGISVSEDDGDVAEKRAGFTHAVDSGEGFSKMRFSDRRKPGQQSGGRYSRLDDDALGGRGFYINPCFG